MREAAARPHAHPANAGEPDCGTLRPTCNDSSHNMLEWPVSLSVKAEPFMCQTVAYEQSGLPENIASNILNSCQPNNLFEQEKIATIVHASLIDSIKIIEHSVLEE